MSGSHRRHDLCWALVGAVAAVLASFVLIPFTLYALTGSTILVFLAGEQVGVALVDVFLLPVVVIVLLIPVGLLGWGIVAFIGQRRRAARVRR